jgi:hypothetical protein
LETWLPPQVARGLTREVITIAGLLGLVKERREFKLMEARQSVTM